MDGHESELAEPLVQQVQGNILRTDRAQACKLCTCNVHSDSAVTLCLLNKVAIIHKDLGLQQTHSGMRGQQHIGKSVADKVLRSVAVLASDNDVQASHSELHVV